MPQSGRQSRNATVAVKKIGRVSIVYKSGRSGTRFVQYMSQGDVDRLHTLKEALAGPTEFAVYDVRGVFKKEAVKKNTSVTLVPIDIHQITFDSLIAVSN